DPSQGLGVAVIESSSPARTPPCPEQDDPPPRARPPAGRAAQTEALLRQVRCPVLVIGSQASQDEGGPGEPPDGSARIAGLTGGDLLLLEGAGHGPQITEPVMINRELAAFAG